MRINEIEKIWENEEKEEKKKNEKNQKNQKKTDISTNAETDKDGKTKGK